MSYDIGPRIGIEGEREFRAAINQINTSMKTLDTEMQAVASQFDKNDKSTEALTAKNEVLNKQIDVQKSKLSELQKGLAQAAEKYGENDKVTQGWQQAVNKATAELNNMDRELSSNNKALLEFGEEAKNAAEKAKKLEKAHKDLESALSSVKKSAGNAVKVVAGLALGMAGAASAVFGFTMKASENADEIQRLSDITGLTAERIQELRYAGNNLGVDLETITGAQAKLTKAMTAAEKGTGLQAEAFKRLKIDAFDPATGAMRDSKVVMQEALNALNGVGNETERDSLAMQLFGKSAMDLNPLIKAGGDELKRLSDEANKTGAVMSGENISALDAFGDTVDGIKQSALGLAGNIASQLLPSLQPLADKIKNIDPKPIVDGFNWVINNANNIAAGAVAIGVGMVTWNVASMINGVVQAIKAFQLANEGATIAQAALNLAMSANPIGIIITAVAALVAAIIYLWNTNEGFRTAVIKVWETIKNAIVGFVNAVISFVKNNWQLLLLFLVNPIAGALKLFYDMNPKFKAWVDGVFTLIVKTLKGLPGKMVDLGQNIIDGIAQGVKNAAKNLAGSVVDAAKGALNSAKKFLGIHSPSTVMRDQVGKMIGAGMAEGITDSSRKINAAMQSLNKTIVADKETKIQTKNISSSDDVADNENGSTETVVNVYTTLDGKVVAKSTSRVQAQKNKSKARALGVIPV